MLSGLLEKIHGSKVKILKAPKHLLYSQEQKDELQFMDMVSSYISESLGISMTANFIGSGLVYCLSDSSYSKFRIDCVKDGLHSRQNNLGSNFYEIDSDNFIETILEDEDFFGIVPCSSKIKELIVNKPNLGFIAEGVHLEGFQGPKPILYGRPLK